MSVRRGGEVLPDLEESESVFLEENFLLILERMPMIVRWRIIREADEKGTPLTTVRGDELGLEGWRKSPGAMFRMPWCLGRCVR